MTNQTETINASEQVNQALADILTKVTSGVDGVVEFSKEQIPDVVEQLLLWHTIENLMFFILGVALFAYGVYRLKIGGDLRKKYLEEDTGTYYTTQNTDLLVVMSYCLPPSLMFVGFLYMAENYEFLKIMVAPKLYLIEYAAKLVGG